MIETAEREERYMVAKPVCETQMREERYCVQRPVTETAYQAQCQTVMRPVTTCQTRYVDQGCYVDQAVCVPGCSVRGRGLAGRRRRKLAIRRQASRRYQRGGLAWTAGYTPSQQVVQRVWRPNVVAQQVSSSAATARSK